jgi:hypothetical protein
MNSDNLVPRARVPFGQYSTEKREALVATTFWSVNRNLVPRARVPFSQYRETIGSGRNDFLVRFDWFWLDNGLSKRK